MSILSRRSAMFTTLALVGALTATGATATVATATPATFNVTSEADSGPGSLREAIEAANLNDGPDTISIAAGLTITLETTVELTGPTALLGDATAPATITAAAGLVDTDSPQLITLRAAQGPKPDLQFQFLTLDGNDLAVRAIYVKYNGPNKLTLHDLVVQDFALPSIEGVFYLANELSVERFTLTGSGGEYEPAIDLTSAFNASSVSDSVFRDNPGEVRMRHDRYTEADIFRFNNNTVVGGGSEAEHCLSVETWMIDNGVTSEIPTFEFTDNSVSDCRSRGPATKLSREFEGGVYEGRPVGIVFEGNTFSNNEAVVELDPQADSLWINVRNSAETDFDVEMRNNTFSGNERPLPQAYVGLLGEGTRSLITHNTFVGGWLRLTAHEVELENNAFDTGASPALESQGAKPLAIRGSGNAATMPGKHFPTQSVAAMTSAEMALAPLSENDTQTGTLTRMPEKVSRLIDAGVATEYSPATDQRGLPRPIGNAPDVGAVETAYPLAPSILALTEDVTVPEGTDAVFTVSRTGPSDEAVSVTVTTAPDTAIAGTDYIHTEIVLEWAAADIASKTVTVPTVEDETVRDSRAFTVSLSAPSEHAELGTPASARGTITDSSTATPPAEKPDEEDGPSASPPPGGATPPLSNTGSGADTPLLILSAVALLVGAGFLVLRRFAHAR